MHDGGVNAKRTGGLAVIITIALAAGASAQSMFDAHPFARDFIPGRSATADLMLGTIVADDPRVMFTDAVAAEPTWREEFNPLNLASVGGRGFDRSGLPRMHQPGPATPAAVALVGLGIAAVVGGRRRRRPGVFPVRPAGQADADAATCPHERIG